MRLENVFKKKENFIFSPSSFWPAGLFSLRQTASPAARLAPFPFSCFSLGPAQHRSDQPSPLPWPISAGNCRRVLFSASPADGQGPRVSAFPILPLAPRQSNRKPATAAPRPCPRRGSVSPRPASTKASRALPRSPYCFPAPILHSLEPWKPKTTTPKIAMVRRPPSPSLPRLRFSPR